MSLEVPFSALVGCDICGGAHSNDEHMARDTTPLDPAVLAAANRIADRRLLTR